jgi:pimeloyl-ACP methyl ester carboxylesterase
VKRAVVASFTALVTLAPAAPADAALRFKRCGGYGFACARLSVPLDRSGAVPGGISLLVKRLRADRRLRRGATFVLAGGPGQSATVTFEGDGIGQLYGAFRNRDLIVYDQRGTGRSGLLRCRRLERANLLNAGRAAGDCANRLGPRRAFYTSQDSAEDIEAIRRELGVQRIALFGTSYGTKVALAYAMRYPGNVERMVLDSVVEADGPDALYRDTFEAVPRALRTLCRSGCRRFTRDPLGDLTRLVRRLAAGPVRGEVVDSRGRRRETRLTRSEFFSILLAGDFDPSLRAAFPGSVRAALSGDATPLLRLRRRAFALDGEPPPPRILSSALYAATTCEEISFPWSRDAPPDPAERRRQAEANTSGVPDSSFSPFDRLTVLDNDLLSLCDRWPHRQPSAPNGPGPLPDVPVLLLEGEDDLRTPVENARRVAALFPRSRLVIAPGTGHSALGSDASGCAERAFTRFFTGRRFSSRCRRAPRMFRATPPPPTSVRRLAPARRSRGLRGRVLTALALTLKDVSEDSLTNLILDFRDPDLARGGGLRNGRYRIEGSGRLTLHRLAYVPGVRVSGFINRFGEGSQRGRLRIAGPSTPNGRLRIFRNRVAGRLGGRRVNGTLRPSVALAVAEAKAAASRLPGPALR